MNKKLMSLSALALSLSLAQAPLAFADHGKGRFGGGQKMSQVVSQLDLSADQKVKIKAICDKAKSERKAKHQELRAVRMQINQAFGSNSVTESKIDEFATQEQQIMGEIVKIRLTERLEVSKVLTDEQKAKMADMLAKWKDSHQDREDDDEEEAN